MRAESSPPPLPPIYEGPELPSSGLSSASTIDASKSNTGLKDSQGKRRQRDVHALFKQKNEVPESPPPPSAKLPIETWRGIDGVTQFTDEHLVGKLETQYKLRISGSIYKGHYQIPFGRTFEAIFKPLDQSDLPYINHNSAAFLLNNRLSWKLIPPSAAATHEGNPGLVMEFSPGIRPTTTKKVEWKDTADTDITDTDIGRTLLKAHAMTDEEIDADVALSNRLDEIYKTVYGYKVKNGRVIASYVQPCCNLRDPVAKRELVKLQLLDLIMGQYDRNENNYLVIKDAATGKIVAIHAIDQDQCFSPTHRHISDLQQSQCYVGLPEVVDRDIYDAILGLKAEELDELLSPELDPEKIAATKSRLLDVQTYLRSLPEEKIIDPKDWDKVEFTDPKRSYVARDASPHEFVR